MRLLENKVVVVTGAGGGIGRGFALAMAAEGASVVVNDVGASVSGEGKEAGPAQKVADEIKAKGGAAVANTDSVAEWESANRIVKAALDAFGRIDCVVNNAGILRDRFFFNMSVEEWKAVIDVHLNGSFFVARAAAPYFKSQSSGSYVNMTSTSGLIGNFGQANYMAAKLGIMGLSRGIALDMQRFKVRSNCIAPFAFTRMIESIPAQTEAEKQRVERLAQMTPDKIAPPAAIVTYPDSYTFDATYGRGSDTMTIPVVVLVGRVSARASRDKLAAYVDGAGAAGIPHRLLVRGRTDLGPDEIASLSEIDQHLRT